MIRTIMASYDTNKKKGSTILRIVYGFQIQKAHFENNIIW